jgi:hypothetical protein
MEVYISRICRRRPDGELQFYSFRKLGAFGSDLAAISRFFDRPYETPVPALQPQTRSWVLGHASSGLRAHGRLQEALSAMRMALRMDEAAQQWRNAAMSASNLSHIELLRERRRGC